MRELLEKLLENRSAFGRDGNRRRLFTRFDEIFENQPLLEGDPLSSVDLKRARTEGFEFSKIQLQNWKAFENFEINFSVTDASRPVTLIGGNNGNGKTSILEAIIAGLYGIGGLLDAQRLMRSVGQDTPAIIKKSDTRGFLERAIHRPSFEEGERVVGITIELRSGDELFEIGRRWYFDDDGTLFDDDDELIVRVGQDRDILPVPLGEEARVFYQGVIANLAPPSMISFFLFDGEHVRRLAERELGEQVQFGIESALGITRLRGLIADLNDYIRDRGRSIQADDAEAQLAKHIEELEMKVSTARQHVQEFESELTPLRKSRDEIVHSIGTLAGGTYQERHVGLEFRHNAQNELAQLRSELATVSAKWLPSILIGESLWSATVSALDVAIAQEAAIPSTDDEYPRLMAAFVAIEPKLTEEQEAVAKARLHQAWLDTHPSPQPDTASERHSYLIGHRPARVRQTFVDGATEARSLIPRLLTKIAEVKEGLKTHAVMEAGREEVEAARGLLGEQLVEINAEIKRLETLSKTADQSLWKLDAALSEGKAEYARRQSQRRNAGTGSHVVDTALALSNTITKLIKDVVPLYYVELAKTVTEVYRQLAHKGIVETITISATGSVSLNDKSGRDLFAIDSSAGESQIFAMSLITGVSDLFDASLPLIIDTPLGRLDPGHRERVLNFLANRTSQTVLLSQPEEVGGRYYTQIQDRLAAEYRLNYRSDDVGLGSTVLELGYYPRKAA